jgi:hypothetical protein
VSGGEVNGRPIRRLILLLLATCVVTAVEAERITPVDGLPLLQHTFHFIANGENDYIDVHFIIERIGSGPGNEAVLPPMIGKCTLQRGRNLIVMTLLPGKTETLFQFSINGNGCGHHLLDRYPTDEDARAGAARKYTFLPKAVWLKERRRLVLTEGPAIDPERIRCELTFFRPDPEHDDTPGEVFGQIDGTDGF